MTPSPEDIQAAKTLITHTCDGPLTPFVLMSRACELAAKGVDPETVANALHAALLERGFLSAKAREAEDF